jgi:hypothetical protein
MRFLNAVLFTIFLISFAPLMSDAQDIRLEGSSPRNHTNITRDTNGTGAPFDGGLSLLIAAGVGYASKRSYDKRKKEKSDNRVEK